MTPRQAPFSGGRTTTSCEQLLAGNLEHELIFWMDEILHQDLKPWEASICRSSQGNHHFRVS